MERRSYLPNCALWKEKWMLCLCTNSPLFFRLRSMSLDLFSLCYQPLPLSLPHKVHELFTHSLCTSSLESLFLPPALTYLILFTSFTHIILWVFCVPCLAATKESRGWWKGNKMFRRNSSMTCYKFCWATDNKLEGSLTPGAAKLWNPDIGLLVYSKSFFFFNICTNRWRDVWEVKVHKNPWNIFGFKHPSKTR